MKAGWLDDRLVRRMVHTPVRGNGAMRGDAGMRKNNGLGKSERPEAVIQLTNSPTHQLTNSPTHQLTNSPTHQLTNSPTHQLTNSPTHQLTNLPTYQLTNLLTYQTNLLVAPLRRVHFVEHERLLVQRRRLADAGELPRRHVRVI